MTEKIILGATGRVGQALAHVWPALAPRGIWQHRAGAGAEVIARFPGAAFQWDMLAEPALPLPQNATSMIVLAGVMGQDAATLAHNTDIALAAVHAARAAGITRILVASTQAVYGTDAIRVSEDDPCTPAARYGQAKLAMERALAPFAEVTCLRLGNVAGTDALFQITARGPVTLDRFSDSTSPCRSYIGPVCWRWTVCWRRRALTLPRRWPRRGRWRCWKWMCPGSAGSCRWPRWMQGG